MDEQFKPDPNVPFDEHPNEDAKRRKRWDLDADAAGLAFNVPKDRQATDEERRKVADNLRDQRQEGKE